MKTLKKFFAFCTCLLLSFNLINSYASNNCQVFFSPQSGEITVSGNLPSGTENADVVIQMRKDRPTDITSFMGDDLFYVAQYVSGNKGSLDEVSFIPLNNTPAGVYKIYISASKDGYATDELFETAEFAYTNIDNINTALEVINDASEESIDIFTSKLTDNLDDLGLNSDIYDSLTDADEAVGNFKTYVKGNKFEQNEGQRAANAYYTAGIVQYVRETKTMEFSDMYYQFLAFSDDTYKQFSEFYADKKFAKEFKSKLKEYYISETSSVAEAKENFEKALIFSIIKNPGNVNRIKPALAALKDILGFDVSKISDRAFGNISGKSFSDYEDVKDELEKKSESNSSSGGGGGSGFGGGSSVKVPSDSKAENTQKTDEITKAKYDDINICPWATEAITALSDMNIINGKSEREFAPNDLVLREEFIKLIVSALNVQNMEYANHFLDCEGKWFSPYVNTAYEMGLVNGMGDGTFGAGMEITRQDLSVMIYNALKHRNVKVEKQGAEFVDQNEISAYARDAIGALTGLGILNGYEDGSFKPLENASRAEAAVVIYKSLQYLK